MSSYTGEPYVMPIIPTDEQIRDGIMARQSGKQIIGDTRWETMIDRYLTGHDCRAGYDPAWEQLAFDRIQHVALR